MGCTRFHWTTPGLRSCASPSASSATGIGSALRARRHFVEPARVTLTSRRPVGRDLRHRRPTRGSPIASSTSTLPALGRPRALRAGDRGFVREPAAPGHRPRLAGGRRATASEARFALRTATLLAMALVVAAGLLAPRLAGLPPRRWSRCTRRSSPSRPSPAWPGTSWPRSGSCAKGARVYLAVALVALCSSRAGRVTRRALGIAGPRVAGGARRSSSWSPSPSGSCSSCIPSSTTPTSASTRCSPGSWPAAASWPSSRDFTANQFRYSLGLQMENGHWYAFPYPPAFYVLCWPLVLLARIPAGGRGLRARRRRQQPGGVRRLRHRPPAARRGSTAVACAAAARPCCPSSWPASALAYFPALVGHAVDTRRDPVPDLAAARAGSPARRPRARPRSSRSPSSPTRSRS